MKIAVVAVTRQGQELAEKTAALLSAGGVHETVVLRQPYRKPLRELFGELFAGYQGIICIMALGIVVRLIAPHLKSKITDPAVVVLDEAGRNVISVLSGHWGGANALTVQLAEGLAANPVITTATDVNGLPAIEMLARERGWVIEPFELVKKVNAAIVNGGKVTIYSEWPFDIEETEQLQVKDFAGYSPARPEKGRVVLVTNRAARSYPPGTLFIRPRNLCVGVGCRRGVTAQEVQEAVVAAVEEAGLAMNSVQGLASVDIKRDEQGLLAAAGELELPVAFYSGPELTDVIRQRGSELGFSEFVDKKIGVGGVCEPAAILGAGETSKLLKPKTKYDRVTIAIAGGGWQ